MRKPAFAFNIPLSYIANIACSYFSSIYSVRLMKTKRVVTYSRLRLIGATALCYALKMLQRVFRCCANEYKMDVDKFGLLFFLFSGVYAYNSNIRECSAT